MISSQALARAMPGLQQAKPRPYVVRFGGGWDDETPPMAVPPGFLRASRNWECDVLGGYGRVLGYERMDGRTSPSAGVAKVIDITLTGAIAVGDTVTGVTSGSTAVVIAVPSATSIVVTKISTAFTTSAPWDVLSVSGNPQATMTAAAHGASTSLLRAQYKNLAADSYRSDIAAPTGAGSSLGGVKFGGVLYTWRNNAGNTATNIWKSTAAGWSQITLYNEVSFTLGGATAPAEGAVITLTASGATATIKRVVLTTASTTWATNTAAGRLIITTPTGAGFSAGGAATAGAINFTLTASTQAAITLQPSGRYEFIVENFGGGINTNRIYGADGVNRGFEFDGDILVPITTGMTTDTPSHVHSHMHQLFFSFVGSVQHCAPGTPYVWSVILGAAEIGMGDTVTGFQSQPGSTTSGALAIFTRNRMSMLYGTGAGNWQLTPYRKEIGAYAYTIQDMGYTMFLDDHGVSNIQTSQNFGNFAYDTLSARIKTWVNGKRTKAVASCVSRDKSQYRLFFSDGYALYVTLGMTGGSAIMPPQSRVIGMMPVQISNAATWAWSSEESDGSETIYFGSTNGMVYQMEKGTSFDGEAIIHNFSLAWDWLKSAQLIKRFHNANLEISGDGYAEFSFTYRLGYGQTDIAQPGSQAKTTSFSVVNWDDAAMVWDSFVWDGTTLSPSLVDMGGEAENVSLMFSGTSDYHEAIHFSGAMVHYSPRRYLR